MEKDPHPSYQSFSAHLNHLRTESHRPAVPAAHSLGASSPQPVQYLSSSLCPHTVQGSPPAAESSPTAHHALFVGAKCLKFEMLTTLKLWHFTLKIRNFTEKKKKHIRSQYSFVSRKLRSSGHVGSKFLHSIREPMLSHDGFRFWVCHSPHLSLPGPCTHLRLQHLVLRIKV